MSYAPQEYVLFDDINTFSDLGLYKVTDDIGYPTPTGSMDELTRYGLLDDQIDVEYARREMEFEFRKIDTEPFPEFVTRFTGMVQGRKVKIVRSIDPDYYFIGRVGVNKYKTVKEIGTLVVDVNAEPFKYGQRKTETIVGAGATLDIDTAFPTPAVIEITPTTAISSLTIHGVAYDRVTGEDEPIVINNLAANVKLTIDGEKKTVTAGGVNRYSDVASMWEFPSFLRSGNKYVSFSNSNVNVAVSYNPRYV